MKIDEAVFPMFLCIFSVTPGLVERVIHHDHSLLKFPYPIYGGWLGRLELGLSRHTYPE